MEFGSLNDVERAAGCFCVAGADQMRKAPASCALNVSENPEMPYLSASGRKPAGTQLPAISLQPPPRHLAVLPTVILRGMMGRDSASVEVMSAEGARITQSIANGMLRHRSRVLAPAAANPDQTRTIANANSPGNASGSIVAAWRAVPNAAKSKRRAAGRRFLAVLGC